MQWLYSHVLGQRKQDAPLRGCKSDFLMSLPSHAALCTVITLGTLLPCALPDAGAANIHQVIAAQCMKHLCEVIC